jgi:hypothetical protein
MDAIFFTNTFEQIPAPEDRVKVVAVPCGAFEGRQPEAVAFRERSGWLKNSQGHGGIRLR